MAKKVLGDHKKSGKILTPPLLSLGNFIDAGWIDYAVPELIWISLFIEKYGIVEGSKIFLRILLIFDETLQLKTKNGAASTITSSYLILDNYDKEKIIAELKKRNLYIIATGTLTPFLELYPNCPLLFLKNPLNKIEKEGYLIYYKAILEKILYKTSFESSIMLAVIVGFLSSVNRFIVATGTNLPPLEEIFNYPNTEESKHLASFLRSSTAILFAENIYNRSNEWVKDFWNASIKIEPSRI